MEDEMYKEIILDHNRNPRHKGDISGRTAKAAGSNPNCGDELSIALRIEGGKLTDAGWTGVGCAISQAATSMLLDESIGKDVSILTALDEKHMRALLGINIGESREKCMMLGLSTLKAAINHHA